MIDIQNPFLDGDDEDVVVPHPAAQYWGKKHSPAKKAADKALRAAGKVPAGQKKNQGMRRDFNEKDFLVMKAMLKFRYLTAHMIAQLLGVTYQTANGRLVGLRNAGLVGSHRFSNSSTVWFVKERGMKKMREQGVELPEKYTLMNEDRIGTEKYDHELAVNQVAIHLMVGSSGMTRWDESLPLERLITEKELKKAFPNAQLSGDDFDLVIMNALIDEFKKQEGIDLRDDKAAVQRLKEAAEKAKIEVKDRLKKGTLKVTDITTEYPMLWIPTTRSGSPVPAKQFSSPDLVIDKEDLREGATRRSIAIEVELTPKSPAEYEKIMETYRQNDMIFAGVGWFVKSEAIKKRIETAAEVVGFPSKRLAICLLKGKDGIAYANSASL